MHHGSSFFIHGWLSVGWCGLPLPDRKASRLRKVSASIRHWNQILLTSDHEGHEIHQIGPLLKSPEVGYNPKYEQPEWPRLAAAAHGLREQGDTGNAPFFSHGLFGRSTRGPSAPASYTALQRGCSGSAGRQAAGHRRARVVQDVRQMRCLRARLGGMDRRRPEQSGSKRVLHSHTEQAPPPPVPALGGSSSERSKSSRGSRTDELRDEAERLVVPTPFPRRVCATHLVPWFGRLGLRFARDYGSAAH